MNWDLRKTVIGLVSLGALAIVYLLYIRSYQTPRIDIHNPEDPQGLFGDPWARNPGSLGNGINSPGGEGFTYQDRDDQGRIYRELYVADWWHRGDNVWEAKKPTIRLFLQDANCVVTADGGRFKLQSGRNAFPTEAALSGHVVVQIQSMPGSNLPACQLNLDDIAFVGTTSRFTSSGQVDFTSDTIRCSGQQAEFVYNNALRRIEYFQMAHMDGLYLKISKDQPIGGPGGAGPAPTADTPADPGQDQYYQCLLRDRVMVQTPQQVVSAQDHLLLTDVFLSRSSGRHEFDRTSEPEKDRTPPSTGTADDWMQVSVTCDGPVVVIPSDATLPPDLPSPVQPTDKTPSARPIPKDLTHFSAQTLQYSVRTRDAVAEGPVELSFLAKDVAAKEGQGLVPVQIVASQRGVYQAQTNRIFLEGPCLGTLTRRQAGVTEQCSLTAPRVIVDLVEGKDGQPLFSAQGLRYLRADGGTVELRIEVSDKKGGAVDAAPAPDSPLLSGARMVCSQLDFDPQSPGQVITAVGPGTIWLNNSASQKTGRLVESNQPFYALLRQFETLRLFLADNRIVAEGKAQPILVDYFPIIEGRQDSHIRAEANVVQIDWVQTEQGERELGSLTAMGNVYYDDQNNQFAGNRLVYDHGTQWMEMAGPDNQPCSANGVSVWGIRFNLQTRQLQTQVVAPAMGLMH